MSNDAAKGAACVVLFSAIVAMAYAANPPAPVSKPVCMSTDDREKVRVLMHDGFDAAFKGHVSHLYSIWLKEYTETQPMRAITGMNNGINAYHRAQEKVAQWNPPECKP